MDLFYVFMVSLLIQLLHVDAGDVVSSLLGSPEDITCTKPFLWLNTIGYIQCQRECARYLICGVLQFKTDQLECRLYLAFNCYTNPDHNIYLRRTDINEQVHRGCVDCPFSCLRLRDGQPTCVFDRVLAQYNSVGASSVEVDGVFFGMHVNEHLTEGEARNACISYEGRLAILNTQRKIWMLSTAMQGIQMQYGVIGAYKSSGEVKWSSGEPLQSTSVQNGEDEFCFALYDSGEIADTHCDAQRNFICELISGV